MTLPCAIEIGIAVHVACKPVLFLSAQFFSVVEFATKSVHLAVLQILQTWYFPCHEFCCYRCSHIRFFDFFVFMRIQELRELSFKLSYLPLVYPTFFLCVFLSHRSFSFRVLEKVGIRECKVFRSKYYPQGWRFLPKTGGLTLLSRPIPELPLRPERK